MRKLEHFPYWYAGSFALRGASCSEKSRRLKPAARNTETGNALGGNKQTMILGGLAEGNSIEATARICGASNLTVLWILADALCFLPG